MKTVDIPQKDWVRACTQFSKVHDGWLVSLDVRAPGMGLQREIHDIPLRGIAAEGGHDPIITISAARSDGEHFTHIVHAPTHVRLQRTDEGADAGLEVESADGTASMLRFRVPALPETVDGLPRPH